MDMTPWPVPLKALLPLSLFIAVSCSNSNPSSSPPQYVISSPGPASAPRAAASSRAPAGTELPAADLGPDSDYDGRTDSQERADGTDPHDPDSVKPVRLGYWRFNGGWAGEEGQEPLALRHMDRAPSFDGEASESKHDEALLRYRDTEKNGRPNINWRAGSLRFWYRPTWSSQSAHGNGPGHHAKLVEMGRWTANASEGGFMLNIEPSGNRLGVGWQDNRRQPDSAYNQIFPVTFISNQWYEVVVCYTPHRLQVWMNGRIAFSLGVKQLPVPPPSARATGFSVGSAIGGGSPAEGLIDEFETFNYFIGETGATRTGHAFTADTTANPPGLELRWRSNPSEPRTLERKSRGESNWRRLAASQTGWSFQDNDVRPGQVYEYRLLPGRQPNEPQEILAGLDIAPIENRGRVILLVDQTMAAPLRPELEQLTEDLVGDGWVVLRHDVPRHDDAVWTNNTNRFSEIKNLIRADYAQAPEQTKAVFILGHVPVPFSGYIYPDGHAQRPWPTDAFYGDVDGQWTDQKDFPSPRTFALQNEVGDGKFDPDFVPTPLELAVGRVDFADLPAFQKQRPAGLPPQTDTDLLRQYLQKDHRYRHGQLPLEARAVAMDYFNRGLLGRHTFLNAWENGSSFFGFAPGRILQADLFTEKRSLILGTQSGLGLVGGIDNFHHTTAHLADPSKEPPVGFYLLDGSYFGEWQRQDDLLRAVLATPHYGLGSMWARRTIWHFESMAVGETIGDGLLRTADDKTQYPRGAPIFLALMGDPTLRLFPVSPADGLTAKTAPDGGVTLSWKAGPSAGLRYFVYRADKPGGPFTRISAAPLADPTFTDKNPPRDESLYEVRALRLLTTGSGSFTNISQGAFIRFTP